MAANFWEQDPVQSNQSPNQPSPNQPSPNQPSPTPNVQVGAAPKRQAAQADNSWYAADSVVGTVNPAKISGQDINDDAFFNKAGAQPDTWKDELKRAWNAGILSAKKAYVDVMASQQGSFQKMMDVRPQTPLAQQAVQGLTNHGLVDWKQVQQDTEQQQNKPENNPVTLPGKVLAGALGVGGELPLYMIGGGPGRAAGEVIAKYLPNVLKKIVPVMTEGAGSFAGESIARDKPVQEVVKSGAEGAAFGMGGHVGAKVAAAMGAGPAAAKVAELAGQAGGLIAAQSAISGEAPTPESIGETAGTLAVLALTHKGWNALFARKAAERDQATQQGQDQPVSTPEPPVVPLQLEQTQEPMIGFRDGTVARLSEVEQQIAKMEAAGDTEGAFRLRANLVGVTQQPGETGVTVPQQPIPASFPTQEAQLADIHRQAVDADYTRALQQKTTAEDQARQAAFDAAEQQKKSEQQALVDQKIRESTQQANAPTAMQLAFESAKRRANGTTVQRETSQPQAEIPIETKPPVDVVRRNGQPFPTEKTALLFARSNNIQGHEPINIGKGQWALRPATSEVQPKPSRDVLASIGAGVKPLRLEKSPYGLEGGITSPGDFANGKPISVQGEASVLIPNAKSAVGDVNSFSSQLHIGLAFPSNAKRLEGLIDVKALRDKPFDLLDAPSQRIVLGGVLASINKPEILNSVVGLDAVNVVNQLTGKKFTPEMFLHNKSVLKDALPVNIDSSVSSVNPFFDPSSFVRSINAVKSAFADTIAKTPVTFHSFKPTGRAVVTSAAKGTVNVGHGESSPSENVKNNHNNNSMNAESFGKSAQGVDRRVDIENRRRVADLSPDEMRKELLTSEVTGIGNKRSYNEAHKKAVQALIDVDSLKWINDNMGHESGDRLLRVIGEALNHETSDAWHISGDEFMTQGDNEQQIRNIMGRVQSRLKDVVIKVQRHNGDIIEKRGVEVTYGTGRDKSTADQALNKSKQDREAAGLRAGRGSEPPGISKISAKGNQDNLGDTSGKQAGQVTANTPPEKESPSQEPRPSAGVAVSEDPIADALSRAKTKDRYLSYLRGRLGKTKFTEQRQTIEDAWDKKDINTTKSESINKSEIDNAAHEAATSPHNDLPEPTDAQKEAGVYKKGHVNINGLDISIENPAGSSRRPEWEPLKNHYGYIRSVRENGKYIGPKGKDGDHVDVFLGDRPEDASRPVFVIDQVNPKTRRLDEHKIVLGAANESDARQTYLQNYEKGWQGLGGIKEMSLDEFKDWLKTGDLTKRVAEPDKQKALKNKSAKKSLTPMIDEILAGRPSLSEADKLRKRADLMVKSQHKIMEGITPGQPILSTRDRNRRDKAAEIMRKAGDLYAQADALEAKPVAENQSKDQGTAMFSRSRRDDRTNIETAVRRLGRFIDEFEKGRLKESDTQIIGRTPTVLQALGAEDLPLQINGKVVKKVIEDKHRYTVTPEMLRQIPEALYDPLAVFDSPDETGQPGKLLLTEVRDVNGDPVVIAVHIGRDQVRMRINRIASAYGLENAAIRLPRLKLEYIRNKKSLAGFKASGFAVLPESDRSKQGSRPISAGASTSPETPENAKPLNWLESLYKAQEANVRILTEDDVVKQFGPVFSRSSHSAKDDQLTTAWKLLSDNEDAYRYPDSMKKPLRDIAADLDPGLTIEEVRNVPPAYGNGKIGRKWTLKMPDGSEAYLYENKGEVWIDASRLKAGTSRGNLLYHLASTYAHNNDKVFIADPYGVSNDAVYRRTENMLSSALRFGTTRHLMPGERQVKPDGALADKVRPIVWKVGDDTHNLRELLLTSYDNVKRQFPEIEQIVYDFDSGKFIDTRTEQPVSSSYFQALARSSMVPRSRGGEATLKRAAITNTLVRGTSQEGWRRILGSLSRQLQDSRIDDALKEILYSRSEARPRAGFSVSGGKLSKDTALPIVSRIARRLRLFGKVRILVHENEGDLYAAAPRIKAQAEKDDAAGSVHAVFDPRTDTIHLVASKFADALDIEKAVWHEAAGHFGLKRLLGKDYTIALNRLYLKLGGDKGIHQISDKYGIDMTPYLDTATGRLEKGERSREQVGAYLADELLARMHEGKAGEGLPDRIVRAAREFIGAVRNALGKLGFLELSKATDADIAYILRKSTQAARGGKKSDIGILRDEAPMFSRKDVEGQPMFSRSTKEERADETVKEINKKARKGFQARAQQLVDAIDRWTSPITALPEAGRFATIRNLAQGKIAKWDEVGSNIAKIFYKGSKEQQAAIYDYLTTKGADAGVITDPDIRKMAVRTKMQISTIGKALVDKGVIPEEARQKYEDAYLPRVYFSYLLGDDAVLGAGTGRKIGEMGYAKARKDIPKEIRDVFLGEVKDPAYLAARAVSIPMRDLAMINWMEQIAGNPKWVMPDQMVNWKLTEDSKPKQVTPFWLKAQAESLRKRAALYDNADNKKAAYDLANRMDSEANDVLSKLDLAKDNVPKGYAQMPDSPRYGALRGLVVRKEIYDDIAGMVGMIPKDAPTVQRIFGFGGIGTKVTQAWKWPLALDTPLPTPSGWTTMGEVKVGDQLFDERGCVCEVLEVKEILHGRECFEVAFSDATRIIADKDHLWMVMNGICDKKILTTEQIKDTLITGPRCDKRLSIPVAEALSLPDVDLPIAPYALGVWLGDGDSGSTLACAGEQDADEIIHKLKLSGIRCSQGTPWQLMRDLEILNNKHIPSIYLRASKEQRMELLRGLMDTDGWVERNRCSFGTSNARLRDDVVELIRSLGYKPNILKYQPNDTSTGKTGKVAWKIQYTAYSDQPVFNLQRKRNRLAAAPRTRSTRQIVSVTRVPSVPVRCIGVSSPSELFLAGSGFIPTHNSKVAANPPAQVRNFASNMIMLNLSGIPLHNLPGYFVRAIQDTRSKGKYFQIAKKHGVNVSTFAANEFMNIEKNLVKLEAQSREGVGLHTLKYMGSLLMDKTGKMYQWSETVGKTMKIMHGMEKEGLSEDAAVNEANKWLFDYSEVNRTVRYLRNAPIGAPFVTYQVKVLPRMIEVATQHPMRFAPYAAVLLGVPAILAAQYGVSNDDMKALRMALPEWLQKRGNVLPLPMKDDKGRWQFADVGYFFPWTAWTGAATSLIQGNLKDAFVGSGLLGGPFPDLLTAIKTGKDSFTGKDIIDPSDPPRRQFASMMTYAYGMMMPPWLVGAPIFGTDPTFKGFAGHLYNALTDHVDKFGDPTDTLPQALMRMAGVNVYPIDPVHSRGENLRRMKFEIQQIGQRATQVVHDRNLTPDERKKIMGEYRDQIQDKIKDMQNYAKKSAINQKLMSAH